MKKTFFYLLTVLLIGSTFSSCLGDTESSFESTSYGVINEISGTKVASVLVNGYQVYNLSSPNIANYTKGDIIQASFKISFNSVGNSEIVPADYLNIAEGNIFPNNEQVQIQYGVAPEKWDAYKLTGLRAPISIVNSYLLDRSLFTYTYSKKAGETVNGLLFYYDADNQTEANGSVDTYIIDVRLDVSGTATSTEGTTTTGNTGVNFEAFKSARTPQTIATGGTTVDLWFRYYKDGNTTPTIDKSIASMYYDGSSK